MCTLLSGCADTFTDAEQNCKVEAAKGLTQYQSKNYVEAEKSYQSAIASAKKSQNALQHPLMLRQLALCYSAQKKFKEAEASLGESLECYKALEQQASLNTRFDKAVVDERKYETLAGLGDSCVAQNRLVEARSAYAEAIALGDKIVEPPSISNQVKQSYINVLEKLGSKDVAYRMQCQLDAATCTVDEFDMRLTSAEMALTNGKYEEAQKELDTLLIAAKGFMGPNFRLGKISTCVAVMKLINNRPSEAEPLARDACRIAQTTFRTSATAVELSNDYTLIGLARELQGDTASGEAFYLKGFQTEPFYPNLMLGKVERGLRDRGHLKESEIVAARLRSIRKDARFNLIPKTAIDYVLLARIQQNEGNMDLAKETRRKGLLHLEASKTASEPGELRGAYQLYKSYSATAQKVLADRALQQMRLVGERSEDGRLQMRKALRLENLPP